MVSQGERGAKAGSGLAIRGEGMILYRGMPLGIPQVPYYKMRL